MKLNKQTHGQGVDPAFPRLLGERLCLDFANTVESPRANPIEFLHDYSDLVRWGRHVRMLSDEQTDDLLCAGEQAPEEANAVFERAIALRAAITNSFRAIANGEVANEADLGLLRAEYQAAFNHARLTPLESRYEWAWEDAITLERPLWAVAWSAVHVLTEDDLTRVKECPGAGDCGWLFYDTSKNNSRHWCSMEGCGSRVKMRRQYAKQVNFLKDGEG